MQRPWRSLIKGRENAEFLKTMDGIPGFHFGKLEICSFNGYEGAPLQRVIIFLL